MEFLLELLETVKGTPLPVVLIGAGILFILLALGATLSGKISLPPARQKHAFVVGSVFIIGGIVLSLIPAPERPTVPPPVMPPGSASTPPPEDPVGPNASKVAAESWFFQDYDKALNAFARVINESNDPAAKRIAERRLKWLLPYQNRIVFADDFEDETVASRPRWRTHGGVPSNPGNNDFVRIQDGENFCLEGHGHYHATALIKEDLVIEDFEIQLRFHPVDPTKGSAHINTFLNPGKGRFTIGLYMKKRRFALWEERFGQPISSHKDRIFESRWYSLRITARAQHVRVFLDNVLILSYKSPTSEPLLRNLNLESLEGIVRFDDVLVVSL